MEGREVNFSHTKAGRRPFQYSLRTLLIVMTVLAVCLSGVFAGPGWLSVLTALLLAIAVPLVLTILLIYGRGYGRTFCIGALFPAGVILSNLVSPRYILAALTSEMAGGLENETSLYMGTFISIACIVVIAFGLLAVGVRWMVEASQRDRPPEPADSEMPDLGLRDEQS